MQRGDGGGRDVGERRGPLEIRRDGSGQVQGVVFRRCLRVYDDATGRVVQPGQSVQGWLTIGYGRNLVGRGITRAVMAGGITPANLFKNLRLDFRMMAVAARLKVRNAETIFGAIADELASRMPAIPAVAAVEVAGNGYLNVRLDRGLYGAALLAGGFDLAVSDLKMPRIDGMQFYRAMAAATPALARRVIFVTGDVAGTDAERFLAGH